MPPASGMGPSSSARDNSTVRLFDWLLRKPSAPLSWNTFRDADDVVVESTRGQSSRAPLGGARAVRVVPLMAGNPHAPSGGYQIAIAYATGDVPLAVPMADWRAVRELAQRVCACANLPLDEMTERMFSRVGQYTPAAEP
jgi:hypothetical protein